MAEKTTKKKPKKVAKPKSVRTIKSLRVLSRTKEVAELIIEGKTHREVAAIKKVSRQTITKDVANARNLFYQEITDVSGTYFYDILRGSQHLVKLAYDEFYHSREKKISRRRKYRKPVPKGTEAEREEMELYEEHVTEEENPTGEKVFLDIVSKQLMFQAQMMGYIKAGEIPILPQGGQTVIHNTNIEAGATVQINQMTAQSREIEEESPDIITKLREVERLMLEIGGNVE